MRDPNIFISYSRADRPFTRELAKRLRRAYMEVWYDDKLHGGEVWWEEILTSIRECDIFMYLISHASLKSTYCQAELAEAKRLHKLILPVQIRRIQEEIPDALREIQVLDMTEGLTADTITDLLAALMRLTRKIPPSDEPPTSPEPIPMPIFVYRTNNRGMNKMLAALLKLREKLLHLEWKRKARLLAGMAAVCVLALMLTAFFLSWDKDTGGKAIAEEHEPDQTFRTDAREVTQVLVPAGCFMMGSEPATDLFAQADEQPAHEICFEQDFWIDQTEVTNAQYQLFLEDNGYRNQEYWTPEGWRWIQEIHLLTPEDFPRYLDPQQPRVGVSWYEAMAFASWRGGRLCTEAEWEYAARGPESVVYPWGDAFSSEKLVYNLNSNGRSVTVGTLPEGASWVGALDMVGNVAEWVTDWYGLYDSHPTSGEDKVIRGGSWSSGNIENLRAAYRDWLKPVFRRANVGFRVCSMG